MEQIIQSILLLFLMILSVIAYFILMVTVFPKILKISCTVRESSDRGLKKYRYPTGRGIAYEPHPSIRKYIHRYILFTNDGYKYVKCKLDESITKVDYTVIMFDRNNQVIDILDISEKNTQQQETQAVLLHADTSYITLVLNSANDLNFEQEPLQECKLWRLSLFALCVGCLNFLQMILLKETLHQYDTWWFHANLVGDLRVISLLLPSLCIGLIAGGLSFLHIRTKGVRWSL